MSQARKVRARPAAAATVTPTVPPFAGGSSTASRLLSRCLNFRKALRSDGLRRSTRRSVKFWK